MRVRMMGEFQVLDETGVDRTPRGSKARGLIALLCRTPGHRRPRRWLEGKLWSDRGAEQASGSLRQALTELRRALGPLAGHLESDRDCVALTGVSVDLTDDTRRATEALLQGREFLEGLDVMDPAFSSWLAEERDRVARELLNPGPLVLNAPTPPRHEALSQCKEAGIARDLGAAIARLTAEYLLRGAAEAAVELRLPRGVDLQLDGAWSADRTQLRVRLVAQTGHETLWSQNLVASRSDDLPMLTFETVEAA